MIAIKGREIKTDVYCKSHSILKYAVFFLSFICAIGLVTGISTANPVLSVQPAQGVVSVGNAVPVQIIADVFENGLVGYTLTISSSDTSVLSIENIRFPGWVALSDETRLSDGSVRIKAADLNNLIFLGSREVLLADFTVRGLRNGRANIILSVQMLDDDVGGSYNARTNSGFMTVGTGVVPPVQPTLPTPAPTWTPMPTSPIVTRPPATEVPTTAPTWTWTPVPTWTPAPTQTPTPSTYIPLFTGWNFISIPLNLANEFNTAAIFSNVYTAGRSIWSYNTNSNRWTELSENTRLQPMEGYWIYSANNMLVPLIYSQNVMSTSRQLYSGWNAFGPFGTSPSPANVVLSPVRRDWTTTLGFSTPFQLWEPAIINGGHGQFSDNRELVPMKGYWLFMTTDGRIDIIA